MRELTQQVGWKTQDGRMTKKSGARLCIPHLTRHFYIILPSCYVSSLFTKERMAHAVTGNGAYLFDLLRLVMMEITTFIAKGLTPVFKTRGWTTNAKEFYKITVTTRALIGQKSMGSEHWIREFKKLRRQLQQKRHIKIELCINWSALR